MTKYIITIIIIITSVYIAYIYQYTNINMYDNLMYIYPQNYKINLEIADNDKTREEGLMYRQSLGEYSGMIFIFENEAQRAFWMRNTYIALDMIFLDSNQKIVHIHTGAKILDETPIYSIYPAKYVIELNSGSANKRGIHIGNQLEIFEK